MNDAIDDLVAMRLAGAGPVLDDHEYLYPPAKWSSVLPSPFHPAAAQVAEYLDKAQPASPADVPWHHPHAAQPGNMQSMADVVAERDILRAWLKALLKVAPAYVNEGGEYGPPFECPYCDMGERGRPYDEAADVFDSWEFDDFAVPDNHDTICPWRQAAEYVAALEVKP